MPMEKVYPAEESRRPRSRLKAVGMISRASNPFQGSFLVQRETLMKKDWDPWPPPNATHTATDANSRETGLLVPNEEGGGNGSLVGKMAPFKLQNPALLNTTYDTSIYRG